MVKRKKISGRTWVSIITALLLAIIIYSAREDLRTAWDLLWQVDLWKLSLIIPLQILSYFAAAEAMFSYLRQKGPVKASPWERTKMALELNFVNHILPSAGVSGASYMTWRLKKIGISAGRGTIAQVIRLAVTFAGFLILLMLSVVIITFDDGISRFTLLVSSGLASTIIFALLAAIYFLSSDKRLRSASRFTSRTINSLGRKILRRKAAMVHENKITEYFGELSDDYKAISKDWRLLKVPLFWGVIFTLADVGMFWVTFWALGEPINPAPLLIGYGLAVIAGAFFITPGGAGGYEVLMIAFLSTTGINGGVIVAGVILTRMLLISGTIITGYIFYQQALVKYGKRPA